MDRVRSRLFINLESFLLRLGRKRSKWRQWYIKQKDDALGREMIGIDKFGNRYYQYYSYHGLPTKRIVLYNFYDKNKFHIDPHFIDWLYKRELLAPTPEQLEKLYLEHDAFIERALQWDEEQQIMIDEYKRKKKQLDLEAEQDAKKIEEGKEVNPSKWIPDPNKGKGNEIVQLTQMDQIEKEYFEEYQKIMEKDDSKNKDFNKLAYDQAKKARYYFEYMRTQEKLYLYEKQKLQEIQDQTPLNIAQKQQEKRNEIQNQEETKTDKLNKVLNQESIKKFEEKIDNKKEELKSNRYEQFREQFEDIFEQILDEKIAKQEQKKM